jgi:SAM-dependent methyltransferase
MKRYCPVCDQSVEHDPVYVKNGFQIVRCRGCGLGATVLPEGFDPASIYDQGYYQGGQTDGYADYTAAEPVLRREFAQSVRSLRRHGPASGSLLEIGCAYGYFLLEAAAHYSVRGLEVSPHAVAAAQARGLDVSNRSLTEHFAIHPEPVDAVVMLDAVEHLASPGELLKEAVSQLKPGGAILISTGDWDSLLAKMMGPSWRLMTPPQHLFFFSPRTLGMLLTRAGCEVVHISKPWKTVPIGLMAYQLGARSGFRWRALERVQSLGLPVNLFDAFRIIARKTGDDPSANSKNERTAKNEKTR